MRIVRKNALPMPSLFKWIHAQATAITLDKRNRNHGKWTNRWKEWGAMDAQATNNLIATVGVIISVLAFIVSIRALGAQRKHNELSARPIIDASFGRDDRLIELTNCGPGPALITSIRAQIEDECFDLMQDEGLTRLAHSIAGVLKRGTVLTPLRLTARSPLPPSQSKPLLSLRKPFSENELDDIRLRLRAVSLTVEYECIYQRSHVFQHEST